jgi:hypothetical protein
MQCRPRTSGGRSRWHQLKEIASDLPAEAPIGCRREDLPLAEAYISSQTGVRGIATERPNCADRKAGLS